MNDIHLHIVEYEKNEALNARFVKAITSNNLQEVNHCLDEGVDVNISTAYKTAISNVLHEKKIYPLSQAVHFASTEMILLLLNKGADIHIDNGDLLSIAMKNNRFNIIQLLIEQGFDLNQYKEKVFYDCLVCRTIQSLSIISCYIDFKDYLNESFFCTTFYNQLNEHFKDFLQRLFNSYQLHESLSNSLIIREKDTFKNIKL